MSFADNLKNIRKDQDLSQQELADKLKIAQSTVGMWESGKRTPKLNEIQRLSRILDVTVHRLVGDKEKKIEIIKGEIYVDGKKVENLDKSDVNKVIDQIQHLRATSESTERDVKPPFGAETKKILIIDDEQEMCETLYSFLVAHNYKVFLSFNGQMGLEYFEEIKPDVVLLDMTMPDMNGTDVLRIIRKVSDVPVLVITAYPGNIADIHLEDLHIEGYLEKPFSLSEVLNTLKHLIGE